MTKYYTEIRYNYFPNITEYEQIVYDKSYKVWQTVCQELGAHVYARGRINSVMSKKTEFLNT